MYFTPGHIAWHASAGFALLVLEQPDTIKGEMAIPSTMAQTCPNWDKWTDDNTVRKLKPPPAPGSPDTPD